MNSGGEARMKQLHTVIDAPQTNASRMAPSRTDAPQTDASRTITPRTPAYRATADQATANGQLAHPRTSSEARDLTRGFLSTLSSPPSPESVETGLLVVSELVTNAFRHTPGLTEFTLDATGRDVRVTVGDSSTALPRERSRDLDDPDDNGGFGWPLVLHFATRVAIHIGPDHTKRIRVTLPI